MIEAKNQETASFLNMMLNKEKAARARRKTAREDNRTMRLACVQYHVDGSETKIWRNE